MKKINTAPISGMQELLPKEQALFDHFKQQIAKTFAINGFLNIETPAIDRTEVLLAKAGGETEKQIYRVFKTAETADDSDQALCFDHTVPLARYLAEHQNQLDFPFRVSQIGRIFRGERAQKGRFREFYQCDIDIIGRSNLPIAYDAEIISTLSTALTCLEIPTFTVRLSNRKLLSGIFASLNLQDKASLVSEILDKSLKVNQSTTKAALAELSLKPDQITVLESLLESKGPFTTAINQLEQLNITHPDFIQGVSELKLVSSLLVASQVNFVIDPSIVRGLDYYTGTVFEIFIDNYQSIGSICSGGRYEHLAEYYTSQPLPGVGGAIGLTRLFYVLNENKLVKSQEIKPVDFAIIPFSQTESIPAIALSRKLQSLGFFTDLIFSDKKLGQRITHAASIAKHLIILGESEVKTGKILVKNLQSGETQPLSEMIKNL